MKNIDENLKKEENSNLTNFTDLFFDLKDLILKRYKKRKDEFNNLESNKKKKNTELPSHQQANRFNFVFMILFCLCLISAILSLFSNIYTKSFIESDLIISYYFNQQNLEHQELDIILPNANLNRNRMFNKKSIIKFIESISALNSVNSLLNLGELKIKIFSSTINDCNNIYKLLNTSEICIKSELNSNLEGDIVLNNLDENFKKSKKFF